MSNIVDDYRRSHGDAPKPKSRRWLALGVVLGLMATGAVGSAVLVGSDELPAVVSALLNRQSIPALHAPVDNMAVGSTSKLPRPLATHGIFDSPMTGLIIAGVGLLTGLMVYLGLGRLLPANEPAPHPYELVQGRRAMAQERRYHGGPIRD